MILKKLRENRRWSQEQLAIMAGLSVRTIQRIESGRSASIESLKSLASVLEVSISTLEQEITMIDKTTEKWQALPLLVRLSFYGSEMPYLGFSQRKYLLRAEIFSAATGLILCAVSLLNKATLRLDGLLLSNDLILAGLVMLAFAYSISLMTRMADKYSIW